jgi:hypothetical protein
VSKTSPTQRTLKLCRDHGWTCQVVERWNAFARVRVDLFGFIDLVAMNGTSIIGIQSTSGNNVSTRLDKIKANEKSVEWLRSGGRLFVHGWRKLASSRKWECREIEIGLDADGKPAVIGE